MTDGNRSRGASGDIGANTGHYTLRMAKAGAARVIVIETLHSARWEKNIFSLLLSYGYRVLRATRENAILKLR